MSPHVRWEDFNIVARLGIDVGGTFTDLVFYDDATGEVRVAKGPTKPAALDEGVGDVVDAALSRQRLGGAQFFLHGTTVGINALLERKGALVGLLTTKGFRDVLELRRGERDAIYDVLWKPPPPLVPRRLRLGVTERIRADGTVEVAFDETDVAHAVEIFQQDGVEAVAVVFLNSHTNSAHELAAEQALRKFGFKGEISLSHQVSGEYREYERTSTTVVDAYLRPRLSGYLGSLGARLLDQGFAGELLVTGSGGGAMSFSEAAARPFETIMSGPAAGAVGAAELCRQLNVTLGISADVGGTSFDTCLIVDGRPQVKYEGRVAGMPIQTPWVDVRSIGAGGGSIARVDVAGRLRVGPESAGAVPGPACYGRGGTDATVTDAAALLGMLAFGELAGGLRLDIRQSRAALEPVARKLGLSVDDAARGVLTIVNANMANAIRSVTVEQGQDPREARLIAFGGAGPLFGTMLARDLDIKEILIPNYAGNFSAWGLLGMDVIRSAALTSIRALDESGLEIVNSSLKKLFHRLDERRAGTVAGEVVREAALDLRYIGQEHTLTLNFPSAKGLLTGDVGSVRDSFSKEYERTFGHVLGGPIEIVSVRATARTRLPRETRERVVDVAAHGPGERSIEAYSFTQHKRLPFAVVDRAALSPNRKLDGPAIVLEATATTYVDAEFQVEVHFSDTLVMTDLGK